MNSKWFFKRLVDFLAVILLLTFCIPAIAADTDYDVIVIGAGPAGLTAAITAEQSGAKVLVIEKRSESDWGQRQNVIAIDRDIPGIAQQLGITHFPLSPLRRYRTYNSLDGIGENIIENNPLSFGVIRNAINRDFGGTVKLGEIEQHLRRVALEKNIDIFFETSFAGIDAQSHVDSTSLYLEDGRALSTKFVVDASGSKSTILNEFSIQRQKPAALRTSSLSAAVAHFKLNSSAQDGEYRLMMNAAPRHPYYNLALIRGDEATIYVSPESGSLPASDVLQGVMDQAVRNLKITGHQISAVQSFDVSVDAPEKYILGENKTILVLGDAAHKADPLTGAGVSTAIKDSLLLKKFLQVALNNTDTIAINRAKIAYESSISTQITLLAGYSNRITQLRATLSNGLGRFVVSFGIGLVSLLPSSTRPPAAIYQQRQSLRLTSSLPQTIRSCRQLVTLIANPSF